jgi:hypothetical protein
MTCWCARGSRSLSRSVHRSPDHERHAAAGLGQQLGAAYRSYTLTDRDPDYVVPRDTRTYSFERIKQAIRLVDGASR